MRKYKIATYMDGNGRVYYRIKYLFLGVIWLTHTRMNCGGGENIVEVGTYEAAAKYIRKLQDEARRNMRIRVK